MVSTLIYNTNVFESKSNMMFKTFLRNKIQTTSDQLCENLCKILEN